MRTVPASARAPLLAPPLWERHIARPRLEGWDRRFASPAEQALARAANRAAGWPDWLSDKAVADAAAHRATA